MHTINLLYPQKSDVSFTTITFPDGQPHIKIDVKSLDSLNRKAPIRLLSRIANPADLMLVLFIKNTFDYHEFEHIELHISYLMAARMDRVMTGGEPFSLKVVAAVLNQANFRKIKIFDPHSEVATALIDRSYIVTNHSFVQDALKSYFGKNGQESFCLVSPDAGALKKIHGLAQFLHVEHVVECMKERDVRTGNLTNFTTTAHQLDGLTCFIVDDICDGGGTFIGTAAMLKSKGAAKVVLIVSHGIFSKGEKLEGIDEIFSTDSFRGLEGVHCFEVGEYL